MQTVDAQKAPTLARFASSLNLQAKHKRALLQNSVQLNMDAGNYGWACKESCPPTPQFHIKEVPLSGGVEALHSMLSSVLESFVLHRKIRFASMSNAHKVIEQLQSSNLKILRAFMTCDFIYFFALRKAITLKASLIIQSLRLQKATSHILVWTESA